MPYILNKDSFDTEILWKDTYKLLIQDDIDSFQDIASNLSDIPKWSIVFGTIPFNEKSILFMQEEWFILKSIRSLYKLNSKGKENGHNQLPEIQQITNDISDMYDNSSIQYLADTIWITSRYYHDEKIENQKAKSIFFNWVNNVLSQRYWDAGFVLDIDWQIAGILNLIITDKRGFIDLIGIVPELQWKWYGKQLMYQWIQYLQGLWITDIYVTTEWENIAANKFYQKNDFTLEKIELVYHKHK